MKTTRCYFLLTILVTVFSCQKADFEASKGINGGREFKTAELAPETRTAIQGGIEEFSFKILRELRAHEEAGTDIVVSPFGLSVDLAMLAAGAEGVTQTEIMDVLGFSAVPVEQMSSYYARTIEGLESGKDVSALVANSSWADRTINIYSSYINHLSENYDAQVYNVDFSKGSTIDAINRWCEDHTDGKIHKIVDAVDGALFMLLNALYFKGDWSDPFVSSCEAPFVSSNGGTKTLTMMTSKNSYYRYCESNDMQVAELDYKDRDYVFTILLPKNSLDELLNSMTAEKWSEISSALKYEKAIIHIPQFACMQYSEMKSTLESLGMRKAFQVYEDGKFSGISKTELYVSKVFHSAWLSVDMYGTEAAAVTDVIMTDGEDISQTKPIDFVADHSFIYLVRQRSTGAVLFAGIKD